MKNFLQKLLDTVLPPSIDSQQVRVATTIPTAKPYLWQASTVPIISLLPYGDSTIQSLIRSAKFSDDRKAQAMLGSVIATYLQQHFPNHLYIPIPLSASRLRTRGYNQVESILRAGDVVCLDNILTRTERPPQTSLTKAERLKNMHGSFSLKQQAQMIKGRDVVVIDYVATTGATMHAAYHALLGARPASITCVSLAH